MRQKLLPILAVGLVVGIGCNDSASKQQVPSTNAAASSAPLASGPSLPSAAPPSAAKKGPPAPPDLTAPPADAERSPSGLVSKRLSPGVGEQKPTADDYVDTHYSVWKPDGSLWSTTSAFDKPERLDLTKVNTGVSEGLQLMSKGEKRRLWVPYALAYGSRPRVQNAPKTDLVYDIELVEIIKRPLPPADLAAAPKDAKKTKSGLAYRRITAGTGKLHPTPKSRAEIKYAAWTPEGTLFQTSFADSAPATVKLSKLVPGWSEALQLLVEGERAVFWLPAKIAYGEVNPKAEVMPWDPPRGPLVFDIELVKILE